MSYYIVKFPERDMYLRGSNLLVHEKGLAGKYTTKRTARTAAASSSFYDMEYEIIECEGEKIKALPFNTKHQ